MCVNMISFERSKGFQHKCNRLESLETKRVQETTRVRKTARVWKTTRSIENHKTMKSPGNQEIQEVRKGQRRLPSLKKLEPQDSGRLADYKSQEPGE